MAKELITFLLLCGGILVLAYGIHTSMIKNSLSDYTFDIINFSYIFNGVFSSILTAVIVALRKKFKDQVGFIFMAGSLIKMGLFLALSGFMGLKIQKNVFLDFFVAYVICLILEVYWVSRILKDYK